MFDTPPVPPPPYEQVVAQKLSQCGLPSSGFTLKYENELQSVVIVIGKETGVTKEQFDCINQAAGYDIVIFKDPKLQHAYQDRMFQARRPKMLADARAELEKRGALDGFPERSKFSSDKLFAEALERQCGMKPGAFFVQSPSGLIGKPKLDRQRKADEERMFCLMTAIMYVSAKGEDFGFGFIGNEVLAPKE